MRIIEDTMKPVYIAKCDICEGTFLYSKRLMREPDSATCSYCGSDTKVSMEEYEGDLPEHPNADRGIIPPPDTKEFFVRCQGCHSKYAYVYSDMRKVKDVGLGLRLSDIYDLRDCVMCPSCECFHLCNLATDSPSFEERDIRRERAMAERAKAEAEQAAKAGKKPKQNWLTKIFGGKNESND